MHAQRLILGTAQLAMPYGIAASARVPERKRAFDILSAAQDLGLRGLDTAPDYGRAEEWIGAFLASRASGLEITTKLAALPRGLDSAGLRKHVESALSGSLRRLRTERIEGYLVHRPADLDHYGEALIDILAEACARGRIVSAGVSAYAPGEARHLLDDPHLRVLQHPFSLLDRRLRADPAFPELKARGVSIEARSVLLQGLLTLDPEDAAAARIGAGPTLAGLQALLAEYGTSPAAIALPYALGLGADRALIGVENTGQLRAHVESLDTKIPDALRAAIENLPPAPESVLDPRAWRVDATAEGA